jgi:8-oxo-dGTP pyrophosphatase MutT (NUDIX family)
MLPALSSRSPAPAVAVVTDSLEQDNHPCMGKAKTRDGIQFGTIPFMMGPDGRVQVLLLTSRETRRWVIPKGWPMRGLKPRQAAAREAFEEAGVVGAIVGKRPVGSYHYSKQLAPDDDVVCSVDVFLLRVDRQADEWRELRWVDPVDASGMVLEGGLAEIIRRLFPLTVPKGELP